MQIHIDKESDVTICKQLSEQIVFLISTGKLKAGDALPSVRQMALRHRIHPNTVSEAYKDLVERLWITRQRGKRMVVRAVDERLSPPKQEDLDDLIDATIRTAREHGHTLQELRKRVRARLLIQPPDHVLLVEDEVGLRNLVREELSEMVPCAVESIPPEAIAASHGQIIGALVVSLPGRAKGVVSLLPRGHPFVALEPSGVETHMNLIRHLKDASVIGVASVSPEFLSFAKALLAPAVGSRHALEEHLLEEQRTVDLSGLDLVFCDTVARKRVKSRRIVHYRLVSEGTAREISTRIRTASD